MSLKSKAFFFLVLPVSNLSFQYSFEKLFAAIRTNLADSTERVMNEGNAGLGGTYFTSEISSVL